MYTAFRLLCRIAAVTSLLFVVLDEYTSPATTTTIRTLRWIHSFSSCVLFWLFLFIIRIPSITTTKNRIPLLLLLLVVLNTALAAAVNRIWDDVLGLGLTIANGLTLSVGLLLKWDKRDSQRALQEVAD